ncbi:FliM/FliN family flagellar motor switch protein [Ideonella sp. DXS29W]|uniref:FliM/FliN family flagellar motor switch protein n=1 Tax=Ideonella lacteola TaxID=2984193 RepID=A0ABU9BJ26_9BURK
MFDGHTFQRRDALSPSPIAGGARPAPLKLRSMPAEEAQLRARVGLGLQAAVPHLGAETRLTVQQPQAPVGRLAGWGDLLTLGLTGPHGTLLLQDGRGWLRALTGIDLTGEEDGETQRWLLDCASALLPASWMPVFQRVIPFAGGGDDSVVAHELPMELRSRDHVMTTQARASFGTWQAWWTCEFEEMRDLRVWPTERMAVSETIIAAEHQLPLGKLRRLRPGALIVPSRCAFNADGIGHWRLGRQRCRVRCLYDHLEIESVETIDDGLLHAQTGAVGTGAQDLSMPGSTADARHAGDGGLGEMGEMGDVGAMIDHGLPYAPDGLDSVMLNMQFEVGTVSLSVAEAGHLAPGTVLNLQRPCGRTQVLIRVGQAQMGVGELVDVNGQLGVQIVNWTPA